MVVRSLFTSEDEEQPLRLASGTWLSALYVASPRGALRH